MNKLVYEEIEPNWLTINKNEKDGYISPDYWCGEDLFIIPKNKPFTTASTSIQGNFFKACKFDKIVKHGSNRIKYIIPFKFEISEVKYVDKTGIERIMFTENVRSHRLTKDSSGLKVSLLFHNINSFNKSFNINFYIKVNINTTDFTVFWTTENNNKEENIITGIKLNFY